MEKRTTGRAKTSLVFGQGDRQKAVISEIVVRAIKITNDDARLHFGGNVELSGSIKNHIGETILPIINNITNSLGLSPKNFEISAVNLGAASSLDIGMNISGFSADVPMFLGMLSAGLQIPLAEDFLATGHIASVEGDISAVKAIPAKVEAVKADKTIRRFIHPDLDNDLSLATLTPLEKNRGIKAIMAANAFVRTKAVEGIDELIREVFTEEGIVLASLREGFFGISKIPDQFNNPVKDCVSFLALRNDKRFWEILQRYFLAGECEKGRELLQAFAKFHIVRQLYPANIGAMLSSLICSLPPAVRRLKTCFPILDTNVCIMLTTFAKDPDFDDVPVLFDAAQGKHLKQRAHIAPTPECDRTETSDSTCKAFDEVVAMINEQAFAQKYGIAIDSARGSFVLNSIMVDSYDEFADTIVSFYVHLKRHINPTPVQSVDMDQSRDDATALLERAFHTKGGCEAAYTQSIEGTRSGMRSVLDILTEQFKEEERREYVQRVFKDALNSLGWNDRVDFVRGAMKRLGSFLPEKVRDEPPERFARDYETIIRAYVKSMDNVNQLLNSM